MTRRLQAPGVSFHRSGDPTSLSERLPGDRDRLLPEPFRVEVHPDRERAVVVPHGELDISTVDRLAREIDELVASGFGNLVVDLRRLAFMDSTGLRLLVRLARRPDAEVRLIDGTAALGRLFDLTGLRDALPFVQPHELDGR